MIIIHVELYIGNKTLLKVTGLIGGIEFTSSFEVDKLKTLRESVNDVYTRGE